MMMRNQHRARLVPHTALVLDLILFLSNHSGISGFSGFLEFWILAAALDQVPTTPATRGSSIVVAACPRLPASTE